MATRAPRGAARPNGASAGSNRSAGSSARAGGGSGWRGSGGAGSGRGAGRTASRRNGTRTRANPGRGRRGGAGGRRGSTPYYRRRPPPKRVVAASLRASNNPLLILIGWIAAAVAAVWTELAGGVGFVVRHFGDSARELDPAHRRDGAGLAALAAAIITAATAWWRLGTPAGKGLTAVIRGTFGIGSWALPVLLALLAWRLLRHPDKNAHTGRMVVGWTAFLIGALGIVHIALGSPGPSAGSAAMRSSGGLIGFAISAPLQALLTTWAAIPLLGLLAAFGVLVITGTPVHRIPERVTDIAFFVRRTFGAEEEELVDETGAALPGELPAPRSGRRRAAAAIEAGEHDRPYDTPLLGGLVPRGSGRSAKAGQAGVGKGAEVPAGAVGQAGPAGTGLGFGAGARAGSAGEFGA